MTPKITKKKKENPILNASFLAFTAIAFLGGIVCYAKGKVVFLDGLDASLSILEQVIPKLIGAFFLAGFAQVLVPKDLINKWIGVKSGFKGIMIATLAGVFMPGGPLISFPLIAALYKMGADYGPLVAYLTSWEILGIQRIFIWEIPFMGMKFALLRFAVSLVLPILAGITTRKVVHYLARYIKVNPVRKDRASTPPSIRT